MTKFTTVLASLLRHLSRFDFEKAVKKHLADKGTRALSTLTSSNRWCTGSLRGVAD
jgi:HJR/Mrr/RecB family endonuclease